MGLCGCEVLFVRPYICVCGTLCEFEFLWVYGILFVGFCGCGYVVHSYVFVWVCGTFYVFMWICGTLYVFVWVMVLFMCLCGALFVWVL